MIKNIVHFFFIVSIGFVSCKSENKKPNELINTNGSDLEPRNFTVSNKSIDIESVDVIYLYINYWDGKSNYTFGVNDQTIDDRVMQIFPDTLTDINNLYFGYIPNKVYLKQNALNYFADYIINNCDTVVHHRDLSAMHPLYTFYIIGKNNLVTCVYGDPNRVNHLANGMIEWISNYTGERDIDSVIPYIRTMIYYPEENAE